MSIKHPNKWLCVYPGDYIDYLMGDDAEFGRLIKDLLRASLTNSEPQHDINKLAIDRSHAMWDSWLSKKLSWKKKGEEKVREMKSELKELKGDAKEPSLFSLAEKNSYPSEEEFLEWAESVGMKRGKEYYGWSSGNGWKDRSGKPINNWKRAAIAYERQHNPDCSIKENSTAGDGKETL